jgi:hypothetical protein
MACAWLVEAVGPQPALPPRLVAAVDPATWRAVASLAASGFSAPTTTSAGRLFDAVAALCGLRARVNYEGQAAVELEAACDPGERGAYEIVCDSALVLDPRPAIGRLPATSPRASRWAWSRHASTMASPRAPHSPACSPPSAMASIARSSRAASFRTACCSCARARS